MQSYTRPKCLMPDNAVLMYSCQWSGVFLFLSFFFFWGGGAQTAGTAPGSNIFTVGRLQATTLFNYIICCHLSLPSHQQHRLSHTVDLEHHLPAATSIRIIIAMQVGHHHPIVTRSPCSPLKCLVWVKS